MTHGTIGSWLAHLANVRAPGPAGLTHEPTVSRTLGASSQFSPADEIAFFDDLGVEKAQLLNALANPFASERWINGYWDYRRTLNRTELASLHRKIDRLYYMTMEVRYIKLIEAVMEKNEFRRKYRIRPQQAHSPEAGWWLILAGAFVEGLRRKERSEELDRKIESFRMRMPREWLEELRTASQPDDKHLPDRAYEKFVRALDQNWQRFIHSYENDAHAALINGFPTMGSLNNFLEGRAKDGKRLLHDPTKYWPRPVDYYARPDGGRALFKAQQFEAGVYVNPGATTGFRTSEGNWSLMPYWMRLGMD